MYALNLWISYIIGSLLFDSALLPLLGNMLVLLLLCALPMPLLDLLECEPELGSYLYLFSVRPCLLFEEFIV